jgi:hypothetical protein
MSTPSPQPAGRRYLALRRDQASPPRSRRFHTPSAPFLDHALAISDIYVALVEAASNDCTSRLHFAPDNPDSPSTRPTPRPTTPHLPRSRIHARSSYRRYTRRISRTHLHPRFYRRLRSWPSAALAVHTEGSPTASTPAPRQSISPRGHRSTPATPLRTAGSTLARRSGAVRLATLADRFRPLVVIACCLRRRKGLIGLLWAVVVRGLPLGWRWGVVTATERPPVGAGGLFVRAIWFSRGAGGDTATRLNIMAKVEL